jgi:hypothetical protein
MSKVTKNNVDLTVNANIKAITKLIVDSIKQLDYRQLDNKQIDDVTNKLLLMGLNKDNVSMTYRYNKQAIACLHYLAVNNGKTDIKSCTVTGTTVNKIICNAGLLLNNGNLLVKQVINGQSYNLYFDTGYKKCFLPASNKNSWLHSIDKLTGDNLLKHIAVINTAIGKNVFTVNGTILQLNNKDILIA